MLLTINPANGHLLLKLYIAEKPSLGKAIAAALPKPHKSHKGYIELANGDVVSWCIGHILEQADPEVYHPDLKKWQMVHLPIIPKKWQLKPKSTTRSQLTVLRKLITKADEIIHAGDPDREGQLLVDEVINYLNVAKNKKNNIKRLLINDLNLSAVKRALLSLKPNNDFIPLSISALARARADWLYGINLTRVYTLQGQKSGFNSVLSIGRVQTPLLGLVVSRDIAIEQFVSKPFYEVHAHLVTNKQMPQAPEKFIAKWQPSDACLPYMDEDNRVLIKSLAENVVKRITNQPATVSSVSEEQKKQTAPLPYNLSTLQIEAAKRFSMNAKLVLDVCQTLYEKHKLITYPRSDCRYLPLEHYQQAKEVIKVLANSSLPLKKIALSADDTLKSKAWNNSKISAHHAIIPTVKSTNNISLNSFEKNIFQLIAQQYLAQFYPAYVYNHTQITLSIASGIFKSMAKTELQLGWKVIYKANGSTQPNKNSSLTLPKLKRGDVLNCQQGELIEKITQAPKAYTDATLLAAMTGIARLVSDKKIKKILKETDGLGTEATRANIIELLFKRNFLQRTGKIIQATPTGRALIKALPDIATKPDMTAQWEAELNSISEKQKCYQDFMHPLESKLKNMISQAQQQPLLGLPQIAFSPSKKHKKTRAIKKNRTKVFA